MEKGNNTVKVVILFCMINKIFIGYNSLAITVHEKHNGLLSMFKCKILELIVDIEMKNTNVNCPFIYFNTMVNFLRIIENKLECITNHGILCKITKCKNK